MVEDVIGTWREGSRVQRARPSSTGCPVRLSFVTWPTVAVLGAIVAACLLGQERQGRGRKPRRL